MKIRYLVTIDNPQFHMLKVKITGVSNQKRIKFFLPVWSPGSYLVRDYSRHIKNPMAYDHSGNRLMCEQISKNTFEIEIPNSQFEFQYEVYCKEISVRTSYIDSTHAFLQGPTYLMGIEGESILNPEIEFRFPPLWSKITTGLKEISTRREEFVFTALDYDTLIDTPVEIGCHETDGFVALGKNHELAFYGPMWPHKENLKKDIQAIITFIAEYMGGMPYEKYTIITHLGNNLRGGLEHLNSTTLQFDSKKFATRKGYLDWIALVSHEYFHTWNVKRIRPKELGPFNYHSENYTRLLWLAEGLTSFMDELLVYKAGLCTLQEYLEWQKTNIQMYFDIPGKKFHSLDDSSFNAWIKLYKPDENSNNSSISYYLKGGLVFSLLHFELKKQGKDIKDLLIMLWNDYLSFPERGVEKVDVLKMIEMISSKKLAEDFKYWVESIEDLPLEKAYKEFGMEFIWEQTGAPYLGMNLDYIGDRVKIKSVVLDGPAYKSGLNAGDEIIAINGVRFLKPEMDSFNSLVKAGSFHDFTICRLDQLMTIKVEVGAQPRVLKEIKVSDSARSQSAFK
jgi:predicted metalloprotease with PDZ domain